MGLKPRPAVLLIVMAIVCALGLASELWRYRDSTSYDRAVTAERYAQASTFAGDYGFFAKAYAVHEAREYQQARDYYSRLEQSEIRALRTAALFNAGNTYLEQAATFDLQQEADRAIPLIELAKQSYRAALREDPALWDARYNLERALRLLPDPFDKRPAEVEGRQSPVRTIIGGEDVEPWP